HRAQPCRSLFRASTSVIVPVFREDLDVLSQCLDSWIENAPDELILVVDVEDKDCLQMLDERDLPGFVHVMRFLHTGKRSALAEGLRTATGEIVVLSDSDTAWMPDLLDEVLQPFDDPDVGGVGTRQSVAARHTCFSRRISAWLLNLRYFDYVPALGHMGSVPCLSGRTVAYRREVILPTLPD